MAVSLESADSSSLNSRPAPVRLSALSAAKLWRSSANGALKAAWKADPHGQGWLALRQQLAQCKLPKALAGQGKKRPAALLWGTDESVGEWSAWRSELRAAIAKGKARAVSAEIQKWADRSHRRDADAGFALECLSLAYELPAIAQIVDSEIWWGLVEHLHEIAIQTFEVSLGETPDATLVLAHQALGGELPLVLASVLPDTKPMHAGRKLATKMLSDGILAMTDGEGLPHAALLPRLPLLLACWTRCRCWAERDDKPCWTADAETQYEWLTRQALRLAQRDGQLALAPVTAGMTGLLEQMLRLAGDDSDLQAAAERLNLGAKKSGSESPESSVHSEWASLAVLSADWDLKSPTAVVTYDGNPAQLAFSAGGRALLAGEWSTEVWIDGKRLTPQDTWDQQCWYSDEDCDYLELSLDLTDGVQLVRQALVAREDRVSYLCDLVITQQEASSQIEVVQRMPLAAEIEFAGEEETREGWLGRKGKALACLVPLGLPEWRIDPQPGDLSVEEGQLVLRTFGTGRNLACPLLIDTAPRRALKQRTWRQLTVAESLEKVDADVAVAYRYQSGNQQWASYRSLDRRANRTFLGHNLASEALFGRFLGTGEIDAYFEIEDDA